jgi:RNA polymerase sigma-70 factor (ECF subfamily)
MSDPLTLDVSFEALIKEVRPRLHRYCARMCGSIVEGEDVVQDAILRAIRARAQGAQIDNLEAWLFRIAHNAALDHLRKQSRSFVDDNADVDLTPDPDSTESRLAAAASLSVLMQLPTAQRSSVILMDVLGYSLRELSEIIGVSLPATKSLLHRGREALRSVVNEHAQDPPISLDAKNRLRLSEYVDKFNSRDFDGLRELLKADVKLELVAQSERRGKELVGEYFSNYSKHKDWELRVGIIESKPVVLVYIGGEPRPSYFVLIEWVADQVSLIRDFRYARYVMECAELGS